MSIEYSNGYPAYQPNIDRSTGALPGQHNRASSKNEQLKRWHKNDSSNESIAVLRRVTIRDVELDAIDTYLIVGSRRDTDPLNVISCKSPLGAAIFNKHAGAIVRVNSPCGKYAVEILEDVE